MAKVEELNADGREEFTCAMAAVFEHSPWVAARTADKRPFADRAELHAALCETVMKASDDEKLLLVRAHPDLVRSATLTRESKCEQASAGLGDLSPEEIAGFEEYNVTYRERFGFP